VKAVVKIFANGGRGLRAEDVDEAAAVRAKGGQDRLNR
jgi:hypothetical protein